MPASEADMLPKLAGDQVCVGARRLEACARRSEPVRGLSLLSTGKESWAKRRTANAQGARRPRTLTMLATGVLNPVLGVAVGGVHWLAKREGVSTPDVPSSS